jgi:hypothetical protein
MKILILICIIDEKMMHISRRVISQLGGRDKLIKALAVDSSVS